MGIRTPWKWKRTEGPKGEDWLGKELEVARCRDGASGWILPTPAVQRHEPGQWGELWGGAAECSPSPSPSKKAVLESGQEQPQGIQGSPVTRISPVVQYHLPQVIPPLPGALLSIGGRFGSNFLRRGSSENCRPCPRLTGIPQGNQGLTRSTHVDPPGTAGAVVGCSQPPRPRLLFALERKGKSGPALCPPALNPPTTPEPWCGGRCKESSPSPAPNGDTPEMAAVLSLAHATLRLSVMTRFLRWLWMPVPLAVMLGIIKVCCIPSQKSIWVRLTPACRSLVMMAT